MMQGMEIFLTVITLLLLLAVFLPLVHNDYWLFKVLEYPRLQKMTLVILTAGGWLLFGPLNNRWHLALFVALCIAAVYLAYKVWPYTLLAAKEMKAAAGEGKGYGLKVFSANVYQYNRAYHRTLQQIRATDPDIIFLLETDEGWAQGVKELAQDYPHQLLAPQDNTYGLLFFSRFPLEQASVMRLVKKDIPSIEAVLCLPDGPKIKLWGLHPEPPVPGENLYATAKDKELMQVALKVKDCRMPAVVFGDLNDVAWSHTTELFRKTSRLLDPRRGRGFYSTFSAYHWFIRFPLDYIFCSKEFGLVQMKRLPKNGSDHFATFTHLMYQEQLSHQQQAPHADAEEEQEAEEMAHQPLKEGS